MRNLQNQNAIVTGASGGIGAAIAKKLAERGANVIVHYNVRDKGAEETKKYIEAQGSTAKVFQADFRISGESKKLFDFAVKEFGEIDILVNNAGEITKGAVDQISEQDYDSIMAVNLKTPFMLSKYFTLHARDLNKSGNIINISSIHAKQSTEYASAYAMTKAGLDSLTQVSACELSPKIRVNSVAPGFTLTERNSAVFKENESAWTEGFAMKRYGQPEEIANLVAFLCSEEASWITGQSYIIDGGHINRFNMPQRARPE